MSKDTEGPERERPSVTGAATAPVMGDGRGRASVMIITEAEERLLELGEQGEQLIPGIPNEITLDRITPKLPWRTFHILSSVSRSWQNAIQSRLIYNARVRAKSTETLVVLNHNPSRNCSGFVRIALYSILDKSCSGLPRIELPQPCHCVSLDGRIYVLGEAIEGNGERRSDGVYVLDLAGQGKWQKCASMQVPRRKFGCGVIDEKIYVFGGIYDDGEPVCGSEVYDPKENSWSWVRPMKSMRFNHHVAASGEELYIYGGYCHEANYFEKKANGAYGSFHDNPFSYRDPTFRAKFVDVYHPGKDEWRVVENFGRRRVVENLGWYFADRVFVADGKFHLMSPHGNIYVRDTDIDKPSWRDLQSFSPVAVGATSSAGVQTACTPLAVNGELIAMFVSERATQYGIVKREERIRLFQCTGFGGKNKEIVWEEAKCSLCFDRMEPFMCPIQL